MNRNRTFHPFQRLPAEVRVMIWAHYTKLPYDHHLVALNRIPTYHPSAKASKATKAKKATKKKPAVQAQPAKKARRVNTTYAYSILNASWPLPLLRVSKARDETIRSNPNFLQIDEGPRVWFNAKKNIIHLDFYALHILRDYSERFNSSSGRYPTLLGFENIINLSVPSVRGARQQPLNMSDFNGVHECVDFLRGPQAGMKPFFPLLSGVEFVQWPGSSGVSRHVTWMSRKKKCNDEVNRVFNKEEDKFGKRNVLFKFMFCLIDHISRRDFEPEPWGKPPGVRAPE